MKSNHFLIRLFYLLMSTFLIGRIIFMLYNIAFCDYSAWDVVRAWWNGLTQDIVVTSAALALPALLSLFPIVHLRRWLAPYYFVMSAAVVVLITADTVMYEYWHFKLNAVILSYAAYPEGASSSVSPYYLISRIGCAVAGTLALTALSLRLTPGHTANRERVKGPSGRHAIDWQTPAIVVFAFILMASTVNAGTAYWNQRLFLNHSAANPVFAFFSSFHTRPYHDRYISMNEEECRNTFNGLYDVKGANTDTLLCNTRPNVMVVLLESFGSPFVKSLGGAPVDARLEELIPEGIYWENYYSSSFRTDRAVVSILRGLPAQPTMSVMDLPKKSNALPSVARTLARHGYDTSFYYGGDADYSNMRSYLMATGYRRIVSETDFRPSERTGKWGVADGPLLQRALADIRRLPSPFFVTVMTGSSHEPFDVPYKSHISSPELNAFHYADACLGAFIDSLRRTPQWEKTLVVILPDHLGCYPQHIDNYALWRYELPLLMTGGAAGNPRRIDTICSQTDLPATLLALLGYDHSDFLFSKDIFDTRAPHFAFFTLDDGMGMVTETTRIIHDNHSSRLVVSEGAEPDSTLRQAKAYLQKLYDYIAK